MSRDYQPKIIFGLKLPRSELYDQITDHLNKCICKPKKLAGSGLVAPTAKFCPDCGKVLAWAVQRSVGKFEGFEYEYGDKLEIEGWPVTCGTDAKTFYIGYYVHKGVYGHSGDEQIPFPNMTKEKQFIEDMKRIGLWDEKSFGVWLVLYVSY